MKITINGTTYEAERIPASMSRRAMELNAEALEAAAKAEALRTNPGAEGASALMALLMDNLDRKAELICDVFGNRFSPKALTEELSITEINALLNAIVSGK